MNGITPEDRGSLTSLQRPVQKKYAAARHPHIISHVGRLIVNDITCDSGGRLWGAVTCGVAAWEASEGGVFYELWHVEHGMAGNDTRCIITAGERVIVGHESGCISLYENEQWQILAEGVQFPVRALAVGSDGVIYGATDTGVYDATHNKLLRTPEPVLSVCQWYDDLFVGTASGVYMHLYEDTWERHPISEHHQMVTALRTAHRDLWIGSQMGPVRIRADGSQTAFPWAGPVLAMDSYRGSIAVGTTRGVYVPPDDTGESNVDGRMPLVAVNQKGFAFGDSDNLYYFIDRTEFLCDLLPQMADRKQMQFDRAHKATPQIVRTYSTGDARWLQDVEGYLWKHSAKKPDFVTVDSNAPVTGVATLNGKTVLGLNSGHGIATVDGLAATLNHGVQFVTALTVHEDAFYAAGRDGLFRSVDGETWANVDNMVTHAGLVHALLPYGDALLVVARRGLFTLADAVFSPYRHFETIRAAASDDQQAALILPDGVTQLAPGGATENIPLPEGIKPLCLVYYEGTLYAGTSTGIWACSQGYFERVFPEIRTSVLNLTIHQTSIQAVTATGLLQITL
ncbi:MAG: hypothetical protein AAF787_22775 [Chloroflexota bacterium]